MVDVPVSFGGDTAGFDAALNRIASSVEGLRGGFGGLTDKIGASRIAMVAFGVAAAGAVAGFVKTGFDYAEQIDAISDRTGLAASQVMIFQRASINAGIGTEGLTSSIEAFNRKMGDALLGNESAIKSFKALGINIADISSLSVYDRISVVAKAIGQVEDASKRAALASDLFGKSSSKQMELFKDFEGSMAKAKASIGDTATIDANAAAIERAGKAWTNAGTNVKQAAMGMAAELAKLQNGLMGISVMDTTAAAGPQALRNYAAELRKSANELNTYYTTAGAITEKKSASERASIERAAAEAERRALEQESDAAAKSQAAAAGLFEDRVGAAWNQMKERLAKVMENGKAMLAKSQADAFAGIGQLSDRLDSESQASLRQSDPMAAEDADYDAKLSKLASYEASIGQITAESAATREKIEAQHSANILAIHQAQMERVAEYEQKKAEDAQKSTQASIEAGERKAASDQAGLEALTTRLQQERAQRLGGIEAENFDYQQRNMALNELEIAGNADAVDIKSARELLESEHQARLTEISNKATKERNDKQQALEKTKLQNIQSFNQQFFGNLATLMNTKNRELFTIGKVAAIAQATVNTYLAATNAMAQVPYPFNFAAAAATVVAGMVQVSNIASTSMGGGGGGGMSGGAAVPIGSGQDGVPYGTGIGPNQGGPGQAIKITIVGQNFSQEQVRELAEAIIEARGDGVQFE